MQDSQDAETSELTAEGDAELALTWGVTEKDAPRYSMWKPAGHSWGATIMETDADGKQSWNCMIHDDDLGVAVAAFLERNGAPAFRYVQEQNAYVKALESQLQAGLAPATARDAALASFTPERKAELARQGEEAEATIKSRIASGEFPDLKP